MPSNSETNYSLLPEKYKSTDSKYINLIQETFVNNNQILFQNNEIKLELSPEIIKLFQNLIYSIKDFRKIDVETTITEFINIISINKPSILENHSQIEKIKDLLRENLLFTIYQEYQKLYNNILLVKEKLNSGEVNLDLEYLVMTLKSIKYKIEREDFDTGFEDINSFFLNHLKKDLNTRDKVVEGFASLFSYQNEQYEYNHKNPFQEDKSILPYFNLQKSLTMGTYKSIYFKSNFLSFSHAEAPFPILNMGVNFLPLNREQEGLNQKFVLTLLVCGMENLIHAYDNGYFEEFTDSLRTLEGKTNLTQALILFRFGFTITYNQKEFNNKEEFLKYYNENPFLSEIYINGDIETIKEKMQNKNFVDFTKRLKSSFNVSFLNENTIEL